MDRVGHHRRWFDPSFTSVDALHPSSPGLTRYDAFKHGVHSVGAVVELAGAGALASPRKRL